MIKGKKISGVNIQQFKLFATIMPQAEQSSDFGKKNPEAKPRPRFASGLNLPEHRCHRCQPQLLRQAVRHDYQLNIGTVATYILKHAP